ncbi:MAG TPA: asparagine synthase (glutamine-hydrolyzing) [Nitrospiria bacterium]|jgi:asparagine synthase (glutamine-hydrolysing)|nr:asparagine synthase (glutamine-hydrolyzing) [Nitrospiria bacterium]
MCGIAGILDFNGGQVSLEELHSMCDAIIHRGPDDQGVYLDRGVGIGMRRLSIIDLQTGQQPVRNEDGSVWVVFNGEIYNYKDLRRELEGKGHSFYTETDTETIVHLYEEYGVRCMEKLRGMFTFAIWDKKRRQMLLARDRLGIKPLYYGVIAGRLVFASELKAILQLPDIESRLNWGAVDHLFSFLSTPRSDSIIEGMRKLEPGHFLVASPGKEVSIERYWDVSFEPDYSHDERYFVERLRELLTESVRSHLVSDVPLGAFLSGGIDSSSITAAMSKLTAGPVKTFSIGFPDQDYNELKHARLVAKHLGTDHHELVLEPNVLDILEDLTWHLDEPFGDSSAIPTFMVSKMAAEHVTVVLSGDGGDELFAGYDKYVVEEREKRKYGFLPRPVRKMLGTVGRMIPEGVRGHNFLNHLSLPDLERYLDSCTLFRNEQKKKLFRAEVFDLFSTKDRRGAGYFSRVNGHWLSTMQYWDLNDYLPLDILTKVDRMSMAHSIEVRVPLLDHKLVEFAATIPPELKLRNGTTKYIFKRAMRGILPDEVIDRPKQGFAIPLSRWFRGRLNGFIRELLLSDTVRRRGVFNVEYIEQLLKWHEKGRNLDLQLWTLISFELWCRIFLDRRSSKTTSNGFKNSQSFVVTK